LIPRRALLVLATHRDDTGKLRWVRTTATSYEGRPPGDPDLQVLDIDHGRLWQEVDAGHWDRTSSVWQPAAPDISLRGYAYGVHGLHAITDFEPMHAEPPPDAAIWAVAQRKRQWTLVRNQAGQLEALQENGFDGDNRPVAGSIRWFERDTAGRIARQTTYDSEGEKVSETAYDALGRPARIVGSRWAPPAGVENRADSRAVWE
jgi:hypothetical protein